jgi:cathepsin A (carboxypeptidase C)
MYSGYLDAKGTAQHPGCATTEKECKLHYWFAEAFSDPASKPVVLWLNGGPGSSSILGMLQEHGPLLVNATGGLMKNPYAWNNLANVVILESPTGVGFSYCSTQVAGGVCKNTDKLTAAAARAAMVDFFATKFPELKNNDFFITGESYAGVYVPTLAKELLDNAKGQVNFKGLSVGDPCTDNVAQQDSMDMLWYGHKYGFVPDQEYDLLWNTCQVRSPAFLSKGKWAWGQGQSASTIVELKKQFTNEHTLAKQQERFAKVNNGAKMSPECTIAYRKYLASSSKGFSQGWINAYINNLSLYGPSALVSFDLPGSLNYQTATYMQRADVQKALHVDTGPSKSWPGVSQGFDYTSDYAACNGDVKPGTPSMIDFYREIAPQLDVTLVFNGDTDPCVSYEGTRVALTRVGFAEVDGGGARPWFYNHTASTVVELEAKATVYGPDLSLTATGPQMGGLIVNYEHGLSFQTVHGAGHMVPQFRPQASLHQMAKVLSAKPFTPLLPLNASLANMTDAAYDAALDKWTLAAKAAPYSTY